MKWTIAVVAFLVILSMIITLNWSDQLRKCETEECFISSANYCGSPVQFRSFEEIGTVHYTAKDCIFTKTIIKVSDDEVPEIKALIEGKSIACSYDVGKFDEVWIHSLSNNLEFCQGDLKEALGELILFTEEIHPVEDSFAKGTIEAKEDRTTQIGLIFLILAIAIWIGILLMELKYGKDKSAYARFRSAKSFGGKISVIRQISFSRFVFGLGGNGVGNFIAVAVMISSFSEANSTSSALEIIFKSYFIGFLWGVSIGMLTRAFLWTLSKFFKTN